jgi:hypothetical protein
VQCSWFKVYSWHKHAQNIWFPAQGVQVAAAIKAHHEVVLVLDVLLLLCEHKAPQVVVLQQRAGEAGC